MSNLSTTYPNRIQGILSKNEIERLNEIWIVEVYQEIDLLTKKFINKSNLEYEYISEYWFMGVKAAGNLTSSEEYIDEYFSLITKYSPVGEDEAKKFKKEMKFYKVAFTHFFFQERKTDLFGHGDRLYEILSAQA